MGRGRSNELHLAPSDSLCGEMSAPPPSAQREVHHEQESSRRMLWTTVAFVSSMLLVALAIGGVLLFDERSPYRSAASLLLLLGLIAVSVSAALGIYQFVKLKSAYRCARCGGKTARVEEARPQLRFYCERCNIEWDTGMKEALDN